MVTPSISESGNSCCDYVLGYTNLEHDRLVRQAQRIAPVTKRLFVEAGIGPGQRVLDLGSGMGDVAILLAELVGPMGEVVGVERDASSIARAEARTVAAGFRNVRFTQTDASQIAGDQPFDAAVGRFILMFLPDPLSVLRSVSRLVRPGGVLAFQEPSWVPLLALSKPLPLWSNVLFCIHETFLRSGVNPEMGLDLHRLFPSAGLPIPTLQMETLMGSDLALVRLLSDLLDSVRPLAQQHDVSFENLGELSTLPERIQAEIAASNSPVCFVPIVSAWARKAPNPGNK